MRRISKEDIKKAKAIAEKNFIDSADVGDEGMVSFEFNGMKILTPWIDESGRFNLTDKEAIETYGLENVLNFIVEILK